MSISQRQPYTFLIYCIALAILLSTSTIFQKSPALWQRYHLDLLEQWNHILYLVFSSFVFRISCPFLIKSSPALDHSPAYVSQNWKYTEKNQQVVIMVTLWWMMMFADCFERSKFSASAPITTSSSTKAASQTDRQTDSYSRSDDRPTNRRACACAVHELQKRSRERKRGRDTAWWNKQEQRLSSVLTSSATEEMILRIDLYICALILLF